MVPDNSRPGFWHRQNNRDRSSSENCISLGRAHGVTLFRPSRLTGFFFALFYLARFVRHRCALTLDEGLKYKLGKVGNFLLG